MFNQFMSLQSGDRMVTVTSRKTECTRLLAQELLVGLWLKIWVYPSETLPGCHNVKTIQTRTAAHQDFAFGLQKNKAGFEKGEKG